MIKRTLALFFAFSFIGLASFGVRAYLQMKIQDRPVFLPGLGEQLRVLRAGGIFAKGRELKDQDCFKHRNRCLCLSTLPHRFKKVFERPLFSLPRIFMAGSGQGFPIKIKGWSRCQGIAFEVRLRAEDVEVRPCSGGFIFRGCEGRRVKPGKFYALKEGEALYLPELHCRIRTSLFRAILPRRLGKRTRIFQVERKNLVVEVETEVRPLRASLSNSLTLPLGEGINIFHPLGKTFPLLPPYFFPPQRDSFLYLFLEKGYYSLKNGFYRAEGRGVLRKIGERTGDWGFFRREIERLNSAIGSGGILSHMPCWRAGPLLKLNWFYTVNPGAHWTSSPSLWEWRRAGKRGEWVCGPLWNPHFSGERKVYFKAIIKGPGQLKVEPPARGFLFLNGVLLGRGKVRLREGRNILGLQLRVEGMGKPQGKIMVYRDLQLKPTALEKAGLSRGRPPLQIIFNSSIPLLTVLRGNYEGKIIGLPTYLLIEPPLPLKIRIKGRLISVPLRETKNSLYSLRELQGDFALGDVVILKEGRLWVLSSPWKTSAGRENLIGWRDGNLIWGGEEHGEGETFFREGNLFLVGPGKNSEALRAILPYIKRSLTGRVKLTVRRDLQELAYALLKDRLMRLKERERRRAGGLLLEVRELEKRISRLRETYERTKDPAIAEEVLSLEEKLTENKYRLWKIKNPFYEGAVVVLNGDGAILASASYPPDGLNRGWWETYNVGSTFKVVDSVAFLSSASPLVKRLLRRFPFAGPGSENLKGKRLLTGRRINFDLRNFRGERVPPGVDFQQALAHSYNVYFAYIAMHLYRPLLEGREQVILPLDEMKRQFPLLSFAEALGFNSRFDLAPLPGAILSAPSVFPVNAYRMSEVAHYSIGQAGLRATPLQMALVALSVARGGVLPSPHLVEEISTEGEVLKFHKKEERVFSRRVAGRIEAAMKAVVERGTARYVFRDWPWRHEVYGKTGTAETSLYKDNSIFIGFLKHRGKILVFAVFLPRAGIGAREAAPLARDILEAYIKYLEK